MLRRILYLSVICFFPCAFAEAQNLSLPVGDSDDHGLNSLIQMLEKQAMLEAQKPAANGHQKIGPGRPSPELGPHANKPTDPIDLSRYLGTEGDQEKAIERLKSAGKWPSEQAAGKRDQKRDLFQKISPKRRLDFAAECLKMGKYADALSETHYVLLTEPAEEHLRRALALRLRALYRLRKFEEVEDTYFRLQAYFSEGPEPAAALEYLERQSGIDQLQKAVRENQDDPQAHRKLIQAYRVRNWLDLALEFYQNRLPDKTAETYRHICELEYLRKDWLGLVEAAENGIELRADSPEFHYNLGVGYYHLGDGPALLSARESFLKAKELSKSSEFNKRANWYLERLASLTG